MPISIETNGIIESDLSRRVELPSTVDAAEYDPTFEEFDDNGGGGGSISVQANAAELLGLDEIIQSPKKGGFSGESRGVYAAVRLDSSETTGRMASPVVSPRKSTSSFKKKLALGSPRDINAGGRSYDNINSAGQGRGSVRVISDFDAYFGKDNAPSNDDDSSVRDGNDYNARHRNGSSSANLAAPSNNEIQFLGPSQASSSIYHHRIKEISPQPSTISTKPTVMDPGSSFFLRESFQPVTERIDQQQLQHPMMRQAAFSEIFNLEQGGNAADSNAGIIAVNRGADGGHQSQSHAMRSNRPMKKMSLTSSQSPSSPLVVAASPKKKIEQHQLKLLEQEYQGVVVSPPSSPINVIEPNDQARVLQQRAQHQQQKHHSPSRSPQGGNAVSAIPAQRQRNNLSVSRIRKAPGTRSNLINESKPTRSFQRDVLARRQQRKNHVLKNAIAASSSSSSSSAKRGSPTGGGSKKLVKEITSGGKKKFSRSAEHKPQKQQQQPNSYSARHSKKSPRPLNSSPQNPSILMKAQIVHSLESNNGQPQHANGNGNGNGNPFDSLDEALRKHISPHKVSPVSSENIFASSQSARSRNGMSASTSDFEEAERLAQNLVSIQSPEKENKKKQPKYKPYTLAEYRKNKPEKYVELGKLQPDLQTEELIAKRAKAQRMKEFASNINRKNVRKMKVKPLSERVKEQREKIEIERTQQSARAAAMKYSEQVKRPVVPKKKKQGVALVKAKGGGAAHRGYDEFADSMYDDESVGFEGAIGLEGRDKHLGAPRPRYDRVLETNVDQVAMANLEAENESARLQVLRLKEQFGL